MNNGRIIDLLQEQLLFSKRQIARQAEQLSAQAGLIGRLSNQITTLTDSVHSLEQALLQKDASLENLAAKNRALGDLVKCKSEKIEPPLPSSPQEESPKAGKKGPSPKERGNNNAKRKEHFELEVREHDIFPPMPELKPESTRPLKTVDSIRYEYIPPRFIKHVNHLHYYLHKGTVVCGKLPATPLLNSCHEASFIAGMLQLRYIYSMPVERIAKLFTENGFNLNKSTAHGLIRKTARMFDVLDETLKTAILEDPYLHMDETYSTILEEGPKSTTGKASCKGYIWATLAERQNLVHFFYENGSRARDVLTQYIKPDYQGAVQSDGLAQYKILETDEYPKTIRLACFQHCKRKFMNIGGNKDAEEIVEIINRLYREEHKIPPESLPGQILEHRKK